MSCWQGFSTGFSGILPKHLVRLLDSDKYSNCVELCFAVTATIKGKPAVAQTTLTGSIISNCLTTFGTCLLLGGIAHHRQSYPVVIARTNAQLLVVSLVSITLPTAFQTWSEGSLAEDHVGPPSISYGSAIVLLLEFASYILFFYYTHRRMDEKEPRLQDGLICASFLPVLMTRVEYENLKVKESFKTLRELRLAAREDAAAAAPEDEAPAGAKPAYVAISILVVGFTAQVFTSIFVVEAIESPSHTLGLSKSFVGLIVMPMVISSVEYITAAIRSRREGIAWIIEVAFGSSIRITLFVFPLAVLIGWMAGVSGMTMIFDGFQVTMLALTILLVNHVLQNGFLHW
jgi:Ca2+:H+ antiporter